MSTEKKRGREETTTEGAATRSRAKGAEAAAEPPTKRARKDETGATTEGAAAAAAIGHDTMLSHEFMLMLHRFRAQDLHPRGNVVFVADRDDKVVEVFKGLVRHNFLSCPVLTKTKRSYYGFVDMADIARTVIAHFGDRRPDNSQDFWTLITKEEALREKRVRDIIRHPGIRRNPFMSVKPGYSLWTAFEMLAREPHLHRIAVVDSEQRLINIITQSQLVSFLRENLAKLGKITERKVREMHGVLKEVKSIPKTARALDAFNLMIDAEVGGVAVIDAEGKLVNNISLRDLKGLSADISMFWRLHDDVMTFISKLDREKLAEGRPKEVLCCKLDDNLGGIIEKLAANHVHRIYVVDDQMKPIGVVGLKEVLGEIVAV